MRKLRVVLRKSDKTTCSFIYGHGAKNSFKTSINGLIIDAFLRVNKAKNKFKYMEPWGSQNIAKIGKLASKG